MIWGKEEFLKRETVSKTQKGLMSLTVLKLKRHHTKQVTKRKHKPEFNLASLENTDRGIMPHNTIWKSL